MADGASGDDYGCISSALRYCAFGYLSCMQAGRHNVNAEYAGLLFGGRRFIAHLHGANLGPALSSRPSSRHVSAACMYICTILRARTHVLMSGTGRPADIPCVHTGTGLARYRPVPITT